jgi:hypothetical protein
MAGDHPGSPMSGHADEPGSIVAGDDKRAGPGGKSAPHASLPWNSSTSATCQWTGRWPSKNTFCIDLDRIRVERDDTKEDAICGKDFSELKEGEFPPCQADSGAFMNEKTWWRIFKHPYQAIESANCEKSLCHKGFWRRGRDSNP